MEQALPYVKVTSDQCVAMYPKGYNSLIFRVNFGCSASTQLQLRSRAGYIVKVENVIM